LPLLKFQPSY